MKKIILLGVFILSTWFLAGCANNESSNSSPIVEDRELSTTVNQDDYSDDIDGLEGYLKAQNSISGDAKEMSAQFIGAKSGRKYNFKYNNSQVNVEVYDYGSSSYDDLGSETVEIIQNIKNTGSLKILEREVPAVISDNGKYLLIYSDKSSEPKNTEKQNKIQEAFKAFKKI